MVKGRAAFGQGQKYDYHRGALFGRLIPAAKVPSRAWEGAWHYKRGGGGNRDTACILLWLAESMEDAIDAANEIASEHLEILTADPYQVMTKIRNAGAIFLGEYSSEPLGDYFAGPNHILPTNGTAKFFSPLNVDDFMKKTSIISYSREALERVHKDIEAFAESEGLTAHANSIKVRFE